MSFDPVVSRKITADSDGTSAGFTFPILVSKVVVLGGSDNTGNAKLYAEVSITGTELIQVTSAAATQEQADFDPPVLFQKGLSVDMTGSGAIAYVYYTRV